MDFMVQLPIDLIPPPRISKTQVYEDDVTGTTAQEDRMHLSSCHLVTSIMRHAMLRFIIQPRRSVLPHGL